MAAPRYPDDLLEHFKNRDRSLYLAMRALIASKKEEPAHYASEILAFLQHRMPGRFLDSYCRRNAELAALQQEFEKSGRYVASRYSEVRPIPLEDYNAALLLSFITTHHRYEILRDLHSFLDRGCAGPERLLAVGAGTAYELRLALMTLDQWKIDAYENSRDAVEYGRALLRFFGCADDCLRCESFPLETEDVPAELCGRFGKVILCEVLEHLELPGRALSNLRRCLHPDGSMFVTAAINIAQEDHIYRYSTAEQVRGELRAAGLEIVDERQSPVTILPIRDGDREKSFKKGNLVAVVRPSS